VNSQPPSTLPTIDTELLDSWRFLGEESDNFIGEVVRIFQDSSPAILAGLRENAAQGNPEALHRLAHKLKGSAANLGAARLAASCAALENAVHGFAAQSEIQAQVVLVESEYQQAAQELSRRFPSA